MKQHNRFLRCFSPMIKLLVSFYPLQYSFHLPSSSLRMHSPFTNYRTSITLLLLTHSRRRPQSGTYKAKHKTYLNLKKKFPFRHHWCPYNIQGVGASSTTGTATATGVGLTAAGSSSKACFSSDATVAEMLLLLLEELTLTRAPPNCCWNCST